MLDEISCLVGTIIGFLAKYFTLSQVPFHNQISKSNKLSENNSLIPTKMALSYAVILKANLVYKRQG